MIEPIKMPSIPPALRKMWEEEDKEREKGFSLNKDMLGPADSSSFDLEVNP